MEGTDQQNHHEQQQQQQHHPIASLLDKSGEERQKHVEVCVRIRPLLDSAAAAAAFGSADYGGAVAVVTSTTSNSFFRGRNASTSTTTNHAPITTTTTAPATTSGHRFAIRKPQIPRTRNRFGLGSPQGKDGNDGGHNAATATNDTQSTNTAATTTTATTASNSCGTLPPPTTYAWDVVSRDTVRQSESTDIVPGRTHTYTLDRVYGPDATTQQLFDQSVRDLVRAAMEGYHTAVLAYGQTSTGKTHTMSGTREQPGLIPLCVQECFHCITRQQRRDVAAAREYLLRVSYLEVYKEHIRDLLATSAAAPPVRLFDSAEGLVIKGLREQVVTSPAEVFAILQEGESRRQIGATHMNQHSSRSHVIVRIWIESKQESGGQKVRVSSLSLVDLAGSESVRLTGSSERREEGHYINKSLMTLGQVVYALSEETTDGGGGGGKVVKKHVPYRDSKLTRLLQPCLSGNAQVVLICCISPLSGHVEESHNTFKFATRAKKIPQKASIQETTDEKTLLQSYLDEIQDLKQQLAEAKLQQEKFAKIMNHPASSPSQVGDEFEEIPDSAEIQALMEAIQTMERLILKSNPLKPEDLLDVSESLLDDINDDEENLLALISQEPVATPARTPQALLPDTNQDLQNGLSQVKGLLGTVLKRRIGSTGSEEIQSLRQQLEEQQAASSLRKADASFLQSQLEQKDKLLQEVSKLLEQMEERQIQLEKENFDLKQRLAAFQDKVLQSPKLLAMEEGFP